MGVITIKINFHLFFYLLGLIELTNMLEIPTGNDYELSKTLSEEPKRESTISYSDIAAKLLDDRLFLTALELHCELTEAGKELPKLKEFFSNPGNFEQNSRSEISSTGLSKYFIFFYT